jgi:sigma-B regulation protein RsbU (phosphoserine phosphatase)
MVSQKEHTVLVVDDEKANINVLVGLMKKEYKILVANNGEKALVIASREKPDLILLDIMMPEMDGHEVLRRLKADSRTMEIPVIFLTAMSQTTDEEEGLNLGAVDYIVKPISPSIMMARVKTHLILKQAKEVLKKQKEILEHDLEIGRRIQSSFFPEFLPEIPNWEIATHFKSALQVSGDFYDAFAIGDSRNLGVVVADVCDKGVGAALFMGLFRSLIRAFTELYYGSSWRSTVANCDNGIHVKEQNDHLHHSHAIENIISMVNNYIARTHYKANMFATLFFGVIEPDRGSLFYINAGHESPAIIGRDGEKRLLEQTGPAVGMMPDMAFKVRKILLEPGDIILIYTDGVTEARNMEGKFFGEDRLLHLIKKPANSAEEILERIEKSLSAYTESAAQSDDITLMAVRRSAETSQAAL